MNNTEVYSAILFGSMAPIFCGILLYAIFSAGGLSISSLIVGALFIITLLYYFGLVKAGVRVIKYNKTRMK